MRTRLSVLVEALDSARHLRGKDRRARRRARDGQVGTDRGADRAGREHDPAPRSMRALRDLERLSAVPGTPAGRPRCQGSRRPHRRRPSPPGSGRSERPPPPALAAAPGDPLGHRDADDARDRAARGGVPSGPARGRHGGAARVGAADAHRVRVRRRPLDGRGVGRPARPDRREGRRSAVADPGHPPRVRGRVQGPRRCGRPLATPGTARRRGRRALPRDLGRGTAAAGARAHCAGGALGRQSAVPAGARRGGRFGHARPGVA